MKHITNQNVSASDHIAVVTWISEKAWPSAKSLWINHVNQVIRGTRELLMDSSGLSGIMKDVVVVWGCVVGYEEFTHFASTIIPASHFWWRRRWSFGCFNFSTYEGIAKVKWAAVGKKRWIFKGIFAAIRGRMNRIIFLVSLLIYWFESFRIRQPS